MAEEGPSTARANTWSTATTRHLQAGGETLTYRELGPSGGTPVFLLAHLGATLDEWDPRFIDALARAHDVIAMDLPGVGSSSGQVPATIEAMAEATIGFIDAQGVSEFDLFGFSLGGFIAQQIALDHPERVRRLVLAGTGPAGGHGIDRPTGAAYVYWDMIRGALARSDAKEFLFFHRDREGRAAAREYLRRLRKRVMDRDAPISVAGFKTQLKAIQTWGSGSPHNLSGIMAPTLIANGDHDRMVPTELSEDLHHRIPNSTLTIYPNSGHGGVFQHGEHFNTEVLRHLS